MLPVLFTIGPIKIYTFGVFLVLAFFWASFLLWKNIRLTVFKEEDVFDGFFLSLFFGIFFGRLVYVILNFDKFGFSFLKFILINGYPGISLFGVLIGFFIFLSLFFSLKKIKIEDIIDYFIASLFLALAIGKLGGFFSGEDVGKITNFFLKTKYLGYSGYRHLTGFYEAIFYFLGAIFAQKLIFEVRKDKFFKGFLFYFGVFYFSLVNVLFDNLKENHLYLGKFSFNYLVSLIFLLTTGSYLVYYFRSVILSSVNTYGKKIIGKIHFKTKGKIGKGKGEKS